MPKAKARQVTAVGAARHNMVAVGHPTGPAPNPNGLTHVDKAKPGDVECAICGHRYTSDEDRESHDEVHDSRYVMFDYKICIHCGTLTKIGL